MRQIAQFVTRDLEKNYAKTKIFQNSLTAGHDRINKLPRRHQDNTKFIYTRGKTDILNKKKKLKEGYTHISKYTTDKYMKTAVWMSPIDHELENI